MRVKFLYQPSRPLTGKPPAKGEMHKEEEDG